MCVWWWFGGGEGGGRRWSVGEHISGVHRKVKDAVSKCGYIAAPHHVHVIVNVPQAVADEAVEHLSVSVAHT